jgi:hypothetical protein
MIESSLHQSEPVPLPGPSFGRAARGVIGYGLLTALMMVTLMVVFVPAALLHCALRNGRRIAWAALAVAAVMASLYFAGVPGSSPDTAKMAWGYLAGVILAVALPAMASLPLVERGESFGRVLVFLLAGSALGLAVTEAGARALTAYSPYATQVAQAQQSNTHLIDFYRKNGIPAEGVHFTEKWAEYSMFVLPAVILVSLAVAFVLSLLMLGRLNAWRAHVARLEPGTTGLYLFRNLAFPDWLLFAFVLGGLTPLATGMLQKVAANTLTVVVVLYILQGLAIFRFLLVSMGAGFLGTSLALLMLVMLMFTGVGPLLLGLAGLFDPFFDFRHFKKRKDDSHEGHTD